MPSHRKYSLAIRASIIYPLRLANNQMQSDPLPLLLGCPPTTSAPSSEADSGLAATFRLSRRPGRLAVRKRIGCRICLPIMQAPARGLTWGITCRWLHTPRHGECEWGNRRQGRDCGLSCRWLHCFPKGRVSGGFVQTTGRCCERPRGLIDGNDDVWSKDVSGFVRVFRLVAREREREKVFASLSADERDWLQGGNATSIVVSKTADADAHPTTRPSHRRLQAQWLRACRSRDPTATAVVRRDTHGHSRGLAKRPARGRYGGVRCWASFHRGCHIGELGKRNTLGWQIGRRADRPEANRCPFRGSLSCSAGFMSVFCGCVISRLW
jgi:hypothetical protein